MSSIYKGYDVVTRLGKETVIIVRAGVDKEEIKRLLEGEHPYLFVLDRYKVELYSRDGYGYVSVQNIGSFRGYTIMHDFREGLILEFEIPVSSKLIESINEIRRKGAKVTLLLTYDCSILRLSATHITSRTQRGEFVYKMTPTGEKSYFMEFSTEEINDLMRNLKYVEFIRFEVPVPLQPVPPQDILKKCVDELKGVEDLLVKGDYKGAILTCRNIIMNYLSTKAEGGRVLKGELRESVMEKVPGHLKQAYEKILDALEETLRNNLDHIHKFVKEDTGKLTYMPLREDVEYVYLMLIAIIRYLSQLILTWT